MGDLFLLSEPQMARISPHPPLAHRVPRAAQDALQAVHALEPAGCVRPDLCGPGQ